MAQNTLTSFIPCSNYADYIQVRKSSVHHKGVFAIKKIPKDMMIIEYIGEKINHQEAERRELENNKKGLTYIFILDDKYCLDGNVWGNISKYINHGCDPNCYPEIIDSHIWLIADRDILPGEELYYDYEFPHDDPVRNKCLCGSSKCRGFLQMLKP